MNKILQKAYQEMLKYTKKYYELYSKYDKTRHNHLNQKRDKNGRFLPKYKEIARFDYKDNKFSNEEIHWYVSREVEIYENNNKYLKGKDLNKNAFRCFKKDKIKNLKIKKVKI